MFIDVARLKIGSVRYLLRRGVAFLQYTSLVVIMALGSCWANCGGVDWCDSSWLGTRIIDCGKEWGTSSGERCHRCGFLMRHCVVVWKGGYVVIICERKMGRFAFSLSRV
jgi:hypothetical protein